MLLDHSFLIPASFPLQLRRAKRWLLWRMEPRAEGEEPTKIPYYATASGVRIKRSGRLDGPRDTARLVDYKTAIAAHAADPGFFTGPGFALGDGWWGIDFDHVRDPATGSWPGWVDAMLAPALRGGAYVEVSPSGTGLHVIGCCAAPEFRNGRQHEHVEAYRGGRFFTMTGERLQGVARRMLPYAPEPLLDMLPARPALRLVRNAPQPLQNDAGAAQRGKVTSGWLDKRQRAQERLKWTSADCPREPWLQIGMVLHHESGGERDGLAVWEAWSARAVTGKYVASGSSSCEGQWASFGKSNAPPLRMGTLMLLTDPAGPWALPPEERGPDVPRETMDEDDPLLQFIHDAGQAQSDVAAITRVAEPSYYIEGLLRERVAGAMIATGGTGKTSLLLHLAIVTATGRMWLGRSVMPGSFVLFSRDDTQEDLDYARAHIMAGLQLSATEQALVAERVRAISLRGYFSEREPLTFSRVNERGMVEATGLAQRLIMAVQAMQLPQLRCLALDTLRQFAGGSTNDDRVVTVCTQAIAQVADGLACAGIVLHHKTKEGARSDGPPDQYAGSGSAALGDNSRFIWVLEEIGVGEGLEARRERERVLSTEYHLTGKEALEAGNADQVLALSDTRGSLVRRKEEPMVIMRSDFTFERLMAPRKSMEQKTDDARRRVLACLPATGVQVAARLRMRKQACIDLLHAMLGEGLIEKASQNAPYKITLAGQNLGLTGTPGTPEVPPVGNS